MKTLAILVLLATTAAADKTPPVVPLARSVDGVAIGQLPKQQLPAHGCAAYLWSAAGSRALVAMAGADPAVLRVSLDGTITDLPRTAQSGVGGHGFGETNEYGAAGIVAVLDMTIVDHAGMKDGASVADGALRIDRPGQDGIALPVAGLIGCAAS